MKHETRTIQTLCRLCSGFCGMTLTVAGDQVLEARGDPNHPISRGYACPKGRAIPRLHHSAQRLTRPMVRGRIVSWADALDDLATSLLRVAGEHGQGVLGSYVGSGGYYDSLGNAAHTQFMEGLATRQIYTSQTVDSAPTRRAAELVTGFRSMSPKWDETGDDEPGLLVLFGWNPVVSHGWVGSAPFPDPIRRLREFQARGGTLFVVDPRRTAVADLADGHLAPRPGTDAMLLGWLVRELLHSGADEHELAGSCHAADVDRLQSAVQEFTTERVIRVTGLNLVDMQALLYAIRRSGKFAAISGTGLIFGPHGLVAEWLRWVLLIITGSLDRRGGMYFPTGAQQRLEAAPWSGHAPDDGSRQPGPKSRPDLIGLFGQLPCAAMVDEIEAGQLRALVVLGGNMLTAFPEPERTRAAMKKLDVLVVIDAFESELGRLATHELPAAWMLERIDVELGNPLLYSPQAIVPTGDQRPAWWIYGELAKRMDIDVFPGLALGECSEDDVLRALCSDARWSVEEIVANGMHGLKAPRIDGWVHDQVLPGGRWRLAPQVVIDRLPALLADTGEGLRLVSGRQQRSLNSMFYAAAALTEADARPIVVSPADGERYGVRDGDRARLKSASGIVEARVSIDARMSAGSVWVNHGSFTTNVCELTDGIGIDPLTCQPFHSALGVTLERIPTAGDTGAALAG